jgi:hypothetical protein
VRAKYRTGACTAKTRKSVRGDRNLPIRERFEWKRTCALLRLADLDNGIFERLGRYEAALWRQVRQTIFLDR